VDPFGTVRDVIVDLHLSGKVAVVTGASKGIGLAVTRALASEGVRVVAGALHGSSELDVLTDRYDDVQSVTVDLTSPQGPADLVAAATVRHDRLDILVNNVGAVRPRLDGFLALTDEDWDWALTINFLAVVRATRAAIPHLLKQDSSAVITVSSVNAFLPDPGVIDYSAAKAALTNFCKSLSQEFGGRGVRVNTISPGPVQTDLWLGDDGVASTVGQAAGTTPDEVVAKQQADIVTGRFTQPREIADLVLLLASDRVTNVTGSDVLIDGGLIKTL
jgi:NAD(P)-dependent dehydrogenase (short-subunit alcohol dehydrogenase family)